MMNKQEIQQHRENNTNRRANAEKQKQYGERLTRLMNNPDFIAIIQNGFCGTEIQNYICNAGSDLLGKEEREHSLQMALAGGHLARWLGTQVQMAKNADRELQECDEQDEHLNQMDQE